jgi:hypothetical protein
MGLGGWVDILRVRVGSGGFHVFLFDWRLVLKVCVYYRRR